MLTILFKFIFSCCLFVLLLASACQSPEALGKLDGAITPASIRAHLKILSDDMMEGRAPGTRGGEMAAKYIASQFEEAGLQPAVGDTSYFQEVELIGIKSEPLLQFRGYNRFWQVTPETEFVGWTQIERTNVSFRNKEVIFMGYGIDAPEFNWNDYEDIDVTGKVLLVLVNEPASESPAFFDGPALTYYGRWTYKFEEAARKGADGVILIHTPAMAGYDWSVVQNSRARELLYIRTPDTPLLSLQAWMTEQKAVEIIQSGGYDLQELIARANSSSFSPIDLGLRASAAIRNNIRTISAPNVIARLDGSDPELRDECVIYTSHYDHLGALTGNDREDTIFNGAVDNASGTSALLCIASALAHSPITAKRTILFAAVTAEESGLLGSRFYAEHAVWPLEKTIANINIDALNVHGRRRDIIALGAERSTLSEVVGRVAHEMNLALSDDPRPGQGAFFRSDQFSFANKGVPAVFLKAGANTNGDEQDRNRYHTVDDEYDPAWSLEGAAQIAQFALKTGLYVANAKDIPVWREGERFKRIREQMAGSH